MLPSPTKPAPSGGSRSLHGTCIAINGQGILITGKPGVGKSLLALALLKSGHQLISDDLTTLKINDQQLVASCPSTIKNLLYVRNIGFIKVTEIFGQNALSDNVSVDLVIHLNNKETKCNGN